MPYNAPKSSKEFYFGLNFHGYKMQSPNIQKVVTIKVLPLRSKLSHGQTFISFKIFKDRSDVFCNTTHLNVFHYSIVNICFQYFMI